MTRTYLYELKSNNDIKTMRFSYFNTFIVISKMHVLLR